jgi:lipopolysaccharide transport system permease protein
MSDKTEFELIIEPGKKLKHYWKELWLYRELFYFLTWRDVIVKYKQTVIGIAWAVIRPVMTMVVFSVVFGKIASLPSEGIPYPVMVLAASLPWQLFANSLSESSNSIISNAQMIGKVYFPRIALPVSNIGANLFDFIISLGILIIMMLFYQVVPTWKIVFIPFLTLLALAASLGGGLWISSFNVKYRDFRYIVPFIVQFGLFISPVGFSSNVVPEQWRLLYSFNPMVGVIDGFRWAISGRDVQFNVEGFCLSIFMVFLILASGFWYFRKTERTFADVI